MAAPDPGRDHDPVDRLIDRLEGVRRSGAHWKALCPAHDDHTPSLSVGRGDNGAAIVLCQVGCSTEDVLDAMNLSMRDLFPDRIDRPRDRWQVGGGPVTPVRPAPAPTSVRPKPSRAELGPVVARYPYTDENGVEVFVKTRHDPKTFRVQRPDGAWGIGDAPRVLYRLPELRAAVQAGQTVYLVEGEKDADGLAALGVVATCNFDGAAKDGQRPKWRPEYGDAFAGADVVIVRDRDEAGAAHAQAAFDDIAARARTVRIVESATTGPHDDVSDHLDAGHRLEELIQVRATTDPGIVPEDDPAAAAAAEYEAVTTAAIANRYQALDWHAVFAAEDLAPDWLIPDVIERGCSHAIFSPGKVGKSLLTLDMVAAIATGRARLGRPAAEPLTCLYIDIENSPADLHRRLVDMGYTADELQGQLIYYSFPDLPALDTRQGGQHLAALAEHHAAAVVVLDTLSRVVDGKENDSDTYRALYSHSLRHLKARGITIIRLDHAGKDPTKGQRGSSAKGDDLDTVWYLYPRAGNRFVLGLDRQRSGQHPEQIHLARETGPLRHLMLGVGGTDECADPAIATLVARIDDLSVDNDAGRDRVRKALQTAAIAVNNDDLAAALRVRKARRGAVVDDPDDGHGEPLWDEE